MEQVAVARKKQQETARWEHGPLELEVERHDDAIDRHDEPAQEHTTDWRNDATQADKEELQAAFQTTNRPEKGDRERRSKLFGEWGDMGPLSRVANVVHPMLPKQGQQARTRIN